MSPTLEQSQEFILFLDSKRRDFYPRRIMNNENVFCTVLITAQPDQAATIARTLVEEKLAACVNILSPIRSIYCWEGKLCDDQETLLVVKTKRSLFEELRSQVIKLHSYQVPEIIALPIVEGHQSYLDWLNKAVR